jgi:3-deoxy-D-manno-octulosonate 8-phosphate phosphatase (KDO 8-P phosphatase)
MANIEQTFKHLGGQFITPYEQLQGKTKKLKAIIFDWDGVFNNGSKMNDLGSLFAEPDAMGMNMFKLDYWLRNKQLPFTFIITGENNQLALKLAQREHMHAVFLSFKNKTLALNSICKTYQLQKDEIAFVYDDILDIEVAKQVGVSILINRSGSPLTSQYLICREICDYVTGNTGGNFAVREACELLIGMNGDMEKTIDARIAFTGNYETYLEERNTIATQLNIFKDIKIQ